MREFCVERRELVERCASDLVDDPDKGGRFFTMWAPRQTGKTWIMQRAVAEIHARYGERFAVGALSMQGLLGDEDTDEAFFRTVPRQFRDGFSIDVTAPGDWEGWLHVFDKRAGAFDRPLLLLIDEFDALPPRLIERLVGEFRRMYLSRESYSLHGLALVGVRSVLGIDSPRGSPFNVQRSLHVPNLTHDEVTELFAQYQAESGQAVEPEVVGAVFDVTRGQPGLVGWFGELLCEKYNPGRDKPITEQTFQYVYVRALQAEWNNTVLNLVKKARGPYVKRVIALFTDPNVRFALDKDWCAYLYMNGIIDEAPAPELRTDVGAVCRFSSPFVQRRLYAALTDDMFDENSPILAIEPGDLLADVFTPAGLCVPPLLGRYRAYLERHKERGTDPWQGQPRRKDLHLTEAVGHFHLYAWLRDAVGRRSTITPEFPTGNGKVDLVIRTKEHTALIEVKSFVDAYELQQGRAQAAGYAKKLGLAAATLAVFVPAPDATLPPELSGESVIDGVTVTTVAIGWI
jgi:hypothetical protein